jgi:hypothetical protein
VSSRVEVEELPTQALLPRSRSRVPLTGALSVAALAILLAGGFGLLGGGLGVPAGTAIPSEVAAGPSATSAAAVTHAPAQPQVSPWAPCGEAGAEAPEPVLQVDGHQHFGHVEINARGAGPDVDVLGGEPGQDLERVDVPLDAVTEIWMSGGRCAVSWYISMKAAAQPAPVVLESVPNLGLDPVLASQNRFELFVAPHVGDFELRATFDLDDVALRATWLIHVPELVPPGVSLRAGDRPIQTVMGCDVTQRLANDVEEALNPCERDVGQQPARRTDVRPGEELEFAIPGWVSTAMTAYCGQLENRRFVPRVDPPCLRERDLRHAGFRFAAPDEPGPWTFAISTCATRLRVTGRGFEELCGTWYANIRVRD